MAEYIDREEVLELKEDYGEGQYVMMLIDPILVKRLPTADVIERSEYIELLKENKRLREDLDDKSEALNSICRLHQEYVSKIDKAIEEMDNIDLNEYADNTYQLVNECIEILKRNIGE